MIKFFPSLIAGNILNLETEILKLEPYCDGFHLDVMDFHFVKNLTLGPDFVNAIAKICNKQLFIHLIADNPQNWLNILKLRNNDIFSFHYETKIDHKKLINEIHNKNWLASVALNPNTNIEVIFPFANELDQILIMSVEPGFSGQKFISTSMEKIKKLITFKKENNLQFKIAIDGGVNESNISELAKIGVEEFVVGSAIFNKENPINALENLYRLVKIY